MDWKQYYKEHLMTAEEAVKQIESGDFVVFAHDVCEPDTLVEAMVANADAYRDVKISHMFSLGSGSYAQEQYKDNFTPRNWFASGQTRKAVNSYGDYVPMFFHQLPIFMRSGDVKCDAVLLQCSKPDKYGNVSTGVSGDYTVQAIKSAKKVLVQVNENMPFTFGDSVFSITEATAIVESNIDLHALPDSKIGPEEEAIGKYCGELIEDGATLQLGIGSIPDAVCSQLYSKKHLGIHSEMLGTGTMKLFEAGAIDNSEKSFDKGQMVINFIMGSKELYDFCDYNPAVKLMPVDYVNHPMVIAKCSKMVCINAAIGVDIFGQVAADTMAGPKQFSGVGGQVDFMRGAAMSLDGKGKSIIAMPSSTVKKDGTRISKITRFLPQSQMITDTRHDLDYLVTEQGVARMAGLSVKERARAIIKLSHPEFRDQLCAEFEEQFQTSF